MNNEPVAWMQHHYETEKVTKFSPVKVWEDDIPLYTYPNEHDLGIAEAIGFDKGYAAAQAKTLTDDEILQVYSESEIWVPDRDESDLVEFARAILRKAQENG